MADEGIKRTIPLDSVREQINEIGKAAKEAAKQVRDVGYNLRWDPKDVDTLNKRIAALNNQLTEITTAQGKYQAIIEQLQQQANKITAIPQENRTAEQDAQLQHLIVTINKYNAEIERQTALYNKQEAELKGREKQIKDIQDTAKAKEEEAEKTRKLKEEEEKAKKAKEDAIKAEKEQKEQLEKTQKATDNYIKRLDNMRNTFAKIETVILSVGRDLVRLTQSALEQGKELYNLSVRYNSNAEDIQRWNRTLELATGQSDLYTASLKRIVAGMAEIEAHRGVNYRRALSNIGLNYADISELSTTKQFEAIIDRLAEMEDATARLSAARTLLGDEGAVIAQMFEKEGFDLEAVKQQAEEYAVITQRDAEKLNEMSLALGAAKSNMSVAAAQITISLAPAFETLGNLLKNLSNFISFVAKGFRGLGKGGQALFVIFLLLISVVPKWIVGFTKMRIETAKLKAEMKGLEIQSNATKIAVGSVITGGLGIVVSLVAGFLSAASAANEAKKSTEELNNALQDLEGAGADYGANVESVTTSMSERSINVNVDVYGHGDTDISDEAAMNVAQLTVDQIQKSLGDLVK